MATAIVINGRVIVENGRVIMVETQPVIEEQNRFAASLIA